jgi:hypothetical protein
MGRARVAAVVAIALAGVAGATASWTTPQPLSSGGIALEPEIAANASGGAVAVWDQETGPDCATAPASLSCIHTVETAYRSRSGDPWDTGHAIARPGVGARPQAAINGVGDAALLWVHDIGTYRVVQATLRRGLTGDFPNPNDLSDSVLEVRSHHIALDAAGDAVAVWAQRLADVFEVHAEVRRANLGYWGSATLLSSRPVNGGPALAVTPGGDAFVAWIENGVVKVAQGNVASATWDAPVTLKDGGDAEDDPVIAVDAAGDAVVAWQWRSQPRALTVVRTAFRPAHGSWGQTVDLATVGRDFQHDPRVAIDASGNAVALWPDDAGLRSSVRPMTSGVWSHPVALTRAAVADPELTIDSHGNAVAIWIDAATKRLDAAVRPAVAGTWQPVVHVSPTESSDPQLAIDDAGNAAAVWNAPSGPTVDVQAADLAADWQPTLANTRRPAITGTPRAGRTLVCNRGGWEGTRPISYAYVWRRNGATVHGARRPSYRVRRRDVGALLACRVTATNPARTLAATSRRVRVR